MRVLIATTETQGERLDDYCWTVDGELVRLPGLVCDCPDCGCDRGFVGMASSKATTTCAVAEIPADYEQVRTAFADSLRRDGWLEADETDDPWVDQFLQLHLELAQLLPVHTVLELAGGEQVQVRRADPDFWQQAS